MTLGTPKGSVSRLYYMLPCRAQSSLVWFKLMIVTFLSDVEMLEIMRTRNPPMRVKFFSFTLVAKKIVMMLLLLARGGKKKNWEGEIFSTLGVQFLKNRGSPETNSWRGSNPMFEKKKKIAIRRKIELYRRETFWICVLQEWSAESVLGVHGDSKS